MKRSRRGLRLVALLAALASSPALGQERPAGEARLADLRVSSGAQQTEILLSVPPDVAFEDRSRVRPGKVVVDEVRLFFPGERIARSRLVTVGDPIVEEARLFAEGGGVVMTVVVRRPVTYEIRKEEGTLRLVFRPGVLLAEGAPEVAPPPPKAEKRPRRPPPRPGERRREPGVRGELAAPRIEIPELRPGEGLSVDAEELTYDREANRVIARGRVTIARAGSLLTADEVRIDRTDRTAEAIGNVQLTDPQGTIRAERFHLDLDDETGELGAGEVYLDATHMTITGKRFRKSFGQTYHIENGTFTTCECGAGAPSWSIAGKSADVTLDGYGLVDGATFRILDVPVFYLPKAMFPAKRTRQSGLLAPQFGYSKKRGATFLQPLYLVLNKSADMTLSADVETEARVGGIGEYRYAAGTRSRGSVNFSFFDEGALRTNAERDIVNRNVADPQIPDQRWSVTADLRQELPYGVTGFADVLAVSDDFFLREIPTFSFDPQYERTRRTSRFSTSRGGFYRLWDHATLIGQAIYYQDFVQEDDLTLQRLPQVNLFASQRFFDRRLKVRFAGEGVNFVRDRGFDGPRLDLFPTAEVPLRWKEYLRASVYGGFRETAYHLDDKDLLLPQTEAGGVTVDPTAARLGDNPTRELFVAGGTVGTELYRVFDVQGANVEKLKHTLEPAVEYLYVPDTDQSDLPFYDFTDKISRRNLFTYGLTTRLLAKFRRPPRPEEAPTDPGELNSFTGVAPAPFDDERTRETFGAAYGASLPGAGEEEGVEGAGGLEAGNPAIEVPGAGPPGGAAGAAAAGGPAGAAARLRQAEEATSRVVEWASLTVFQSYDLDESLQRDRRDHFSDVDVRLRLTPAPSVGLLYDSSIDARDSSLTAARVGVFLRDPRPRRPGVFLQSGQPATLGLAYRFIENDVLDEIDGALLVPLADTLSAFYQSRYDIVAHDFLENRWGFRLLSQCRCWILDLSVADRVNPNETEVRAQVTLVGLGSIGRAR